MTKAIRIENADNSNHKVVVLVMQKTTEGQPDIVAQTLDLSQPTQMLTLTIHSGQYAVIKESED